LEEEEDEYTGLFGITGESSVINRIGVVMDENRGGVNGSDYIGGLVGGNNGRIINSYVSGSVSGSVYNRDLLVIVGGLVGYNHGSITGCYATGNVTLIANVYSMHIGGLTGFNDNGDITNCYATGDVDVTGDATNPYIGGLVGGNLTGNITNCYVAGKVTGGDKIGGLIGLSSDYYITDCFFLKAGVNINLPGIGWGDGSSSGITDKTAAQMKSQSTFSGFNFTSVWGIDEGKSFPYLRDIEANVENPPGR
jgi:hypothetical protein